jgi:hypothetical protein
MGGFMAWIILLFSLLTLQVSFAGAAETTGPHSDVELAKARLVIEKLELLKVARKAMDSTKSVSEYESRKKDVEALEKDLKAAAISAFGEPADEAIAHAEKLVAQDKRQQILEAEKNRPDTDAKRKKEIEDLQAFSKVEFDQTVKNRTVPGSRQQLMQVTEASSILSNFHFGVAIGVIAKAGERDLVQSATVDANNIVRVERDNNTRANFLLEAHYFFEPDAELWGTGLKHNQWGWGPFVAIQPGTQNIVEAVGVGLMIGFKRAALMAKEKAPERGDSFNLGMGLLVNPNAQVLGDGIVANQPLPAGETDVRLKTTTELGWLFVFSYSF